MSIDNISDFAEDFLIRNKAHKRYIDVFEMCKKNKITLVPYSAERSKHLATLVGVGDWFEKTDGFAVQVADRSVIFWDDSLPITRQRSTVAHELGHHLLSHLNQGIYKFECHNCDLCHEIQADAFAHRLLFPDCSKFPKQYQN